ncbi:MAG: DUF4258 domain-containing protein [Flavobacteriales bacterium]|nr:DUF4258 domain-containing protein [Flavobacteriia bacterium]NCP53235.1 DUF4258 domain-containing protein [Flavobacteriales bacterium]PIV92821.1 MAG: hypothetical protein COW44_12735 [Flavobacteriaceae bacterium CG17_big_fil_post_rev_8_21_14_2_50_33_15]PIY12721.1 MAG: hypothetical protein COZ17_02805 [Flavobacteriaceae bacterium CG_4_10_14_3_um_filter_33_47]PJB16837.1 MAG: hypothetical protein CO117_13945 [Flavobacteriaceae bacterium CG_4_9_14_3_um_filter_33_16]
MNLLQRIGYYLGGFSIGLIILMFFLNGKKVSCDYGPDARVLKNINTKKIRYSETINQALINRDIDSSTIAFLLKKGDINFTKSNPREMPCGIYLIEGQYLEDDWTLTVQNCDSTATILKASKVLP